MNSSTNTGPLCIRCRKKPKFVEGTKIHDFCCKTCAGNTKSPGSSCDFCHKRPKYVDSTRTHNYCTKTCAKAARNFKTSQNQALPVISTCKIPGCSNPPQQPANGSTDYCSPTHQTLAQSACLVCHKSPKQTFSQYCTQACATQAARQAPMLLEASANHVSFNDIETQFKASWRHATPCPPVKAVYKVVATDASMGKYKAYKTAVEARGKFSAAKKTIGNERRRWHGTNRECRIGEKGIANFCSSQQCSLCCILKTSYKLQCFGKKTGWGRFGSGIYTSSTSSKSNDYSRNATSSPWKAMILNNVVVGKGYKITNDNSSLTGPPPGYDSVLGETGVSLNHDELIVYDESAIRPSWLIVYAP